MSKKQKAANDSEPPFGRFVDHEFLVVDNANNDTASVCSLSWSDDERTHLERLSVRYLMNLS